MAAIAKDNSSGGSNAKTNFETPVVKSESTFFKERAEVLQLIDEICASSVEAPVENAAITEDEKSVQRLTLKKRQTVQDL